MLLHKIHRALPFVFLVCVTAVKAQYQTQVGLGNFGAVHSFYLNPSLNAYSAYKWQVNLAGLWANANNNYLSLRMPYSLYRVPNRIPSAYQTESGNPRFDKNWLVETINGRNKFASVSSDVYGPAFTVKIKSWHVGLFTQASANLRVNRLSEALAHAAYMGFDSSKGAYSLFNSNNNSIGPFNSSGNARAALGLNIAKSFRLDWKRELLLGISIKKVWGFQGYHMSTSGLSYTQLNSDSILVNPTNIQLVNYGDQIGKGIGVDLGATYVFHKKDFKRHGEYAEFHTRYFAKMGFAIMDIGSIQYKNAGFRSVNVTQPTIVNLNGSYSGSSDYLQVLDSFMNKFGTFQSSNGHYKVGLPGRIVLTGDLQVRKNFFVSGVINQSLRDKDSKNARYQSYLMVSPRLEYRLFEFSLPAILEYDYRAFRMGASFRLGPIYAGTNSLMSFVNTRSVKDADLFLGIAFGNLSEFSFRKQARARQQKSGRRNPGCFSF